MLTWERKNIITEAIFLRKMSGDGTQSRDGEADVQGDPGLVFWPHRADLGALGPGPVQRCGVRVSQ